MIIEGIKYNENFAGITLKAETEEEQLHVDSLVRKISRAVVGKRIKLFCVQDKESKALQLFSIDRMNKTIPCAIDAAKPFSVFTDVPDGQWTWVADYSDPEEYEDLDLIFRYLIGDIDIKEIAYKYQHLTRIELETLYQLRFQSLFGKAMQEIGKAVESGAIKITPQFPKQD